VDISLLLVEFFLAVLIPIVVPFGITWFLVSRRKWNPRRAPVVFLGMTLVLYLFWSNFLVVEIFGCGCHSVPNTNTITAMVLFLAWIVFVMEYFLISAKMPTSKRVDYIVWKAVFAAVICVLSTALLW